VYEGLLAPPPSGNRRSILVLGPRRVGTFTLGTSLAPDVRVDLSSLHTFRYSASDPGRRERVNESEAVPLREFLAELATV